jgi:hypothetical protein
MIRFPMAKPNNGKYFASPCSCRRRNAIHYWNNAVNEAFNKFFYFNQHIVYFFLNSIFTILSRTV